MDLNYSLRHHLVLTSVLVFVVVYVVINYKQVCEGNLFDGKVRLPILYAALIVLVAYLFVTWDDPDTSNNIPIYRVGNRFDLDKSLKFGGSNARSSNDIFISQKLANNKFGLKF